MQEAQEDSRTEPYIVTHNLLLSHATVVDVYKNQFQVLLVFMRTLNLHI